LIAAGLQHRELGPDASTTATPPHSTPLFSVSRILTLATDGAGPFIVGAGNHSIFVEGTFDQLKGKPQTAKLMTHPNRFENVAHQRCGEVPQRDQRRLR